MRVISGEWKGLRIDSPTGQHARPTTDRVKESMFHLMGITWQGGLVVDLFAGSGALGIEALSCGADCAVFVDKNRRSMSSVRQNLGRCGAWERASTFLGPWLGGWQYALELANQKALDIGWVFIDPPYVLNLWESVLAEIAHSPVPIQFGIVCEHPKHVCLPQSVECLTQWKHRVYGDIALTLYQDERTRADGVGRAGSMEQQTRGGSE